MDDIVKLFGVLLAFTGAGTGAYVVVRLVNVYARRLDRSSAPELQALGAEVEELRSRVLGSEELQQRVAELEERLDFAERLLSQGHEPARLPRQGNA